MTYLLDVNALVALGFQQHEFHGRVIAWISKAKDPLFLATCPITELGFARILAQTPLYGFTVAQARSLLLRLKKQESSRFTFISDGQDLSHLPSWAETAKRITDGHLAELAKAHGAVLATLDEGIPGVFLIPKK